MKRPELGHHASDWREEGVIRSASAAAAFRSNTWIRTKLTLYAEIAKNRPKMAILGGDPGLAGDFQLSGPTQRGRGVVRGRGRHIQESHDHAPRLKQTRLDFDAPCGKGSEKASVAACLLLVACCLLAGDIYGGGSSTECTVCCKKLEYRNWQKKETLFLIFC